MKNIINLFYLPTFIFLITGGFLQAQNLSIVPFPQSVKIGDKSYSLGDPISINLNDIPANTQYFKEKINSYFAGTGHTVNFAGAESNIKISVSENFHILNDLPDEKQNESYTLDITTAGITIQAASTRGAFAGLITLIQVIEQYGYAKIPEMNILDFPDLPVRGISDDISRGQVSTLENFKKIIDFMAMYKLNTFMPYMEDVLELKSFPQIGKNRGALTHAEVKELLAYAEKNFIEVVPIFQTLGHYENILLDEEFLDYAEFPGAASLNVSNPKTYKFLETMLEEVFELFPSKYFHMGADESFDVGLGKSKHLVDESSIATVHANHYKKIYDICKKHGKTVLMYGDIILRHPEILEQLPKDIIVVDWHYRAQYDYPSTETFHGNGQSYYVSPSVWNFLTTFPTNVNAMPNIQYIIKDGMANGTSGMINSNWGDYGAETIKELIFFGYAWSAQCSWNMNESDPAKFSGDFLSSFYRIKTGAADRLYREFSNTLNQMMWHEVWRHPLLDFRPPVWWVPPTTFSEVGKINWLLWSAGAIERDIQDFRENASANIEHAEIFEFLLDLNKWYAKKLENQLLLHDLMDGKSNDYSLASNQISFLKTGLMKLRDEYKSVWLKFYKSDNLNMIMDKFNRLYAYYDETEQQLKQNELVSPVISSKWIYHPDINETKVDTATFKRIFNLDDKPESAKLQILADTYAELYINGELVQTLFARRSLSLLVDYGRIKYIDIAPHLMKGENTIEVKVMNFNKSGRAGVNIVSEIKTGTNRILLQTDESWQVKTPGKDYSTYAVSFDYPFIVIAPNFETDRTSWIER